MPKTTNVARRKLIDKALISLGAIMTVVLLVGSALAWWAYSYTDTMVHDELASQRIYFPPKGSPALDPQKFPSLQQYAGQMVDNGPKAKAFANEFIGVHLKEIAGGKTYSEISSASLADPTNAKLKAQAQTLFQGETLRGLLLGDAYAFWMVGHIAKIAAIVALIAGGVMAVLVLLGFRHLARLP